jgi:hypothetical protein
VNLSAVIYNNPFNHKTKEKITDENQKNRVRPGPSNIGADDRQPSGLWTKSQNPHHPKTKTTQTGH